MVLCAGVVLIESARGNIKTADGAGIGHAPLFVLGAIFIPLAYWSGSWLFSPDDKAAPPQEIAAPSSPDQSDVERRALEETVATMLNFGGHLCATVTHVQPLRLKDRYEVECIEYRGGRGRVTYIFDARDGSAVRN